MNLTLTLDTTIVGASLGLVDQSSSEFSEVWSGHYLGRDGSARILNSLLADGLAAANACFSNISRVAVSVGPGSFTGIKVGLAWVYGLAAGSLTPLSYASLSAIEEAGKHCRRKRSSGALVFVLGSTRTHGYIAEIEGTDKSRTRLINLESRNDQLYLSTALINKTVVLGNVWTEFGIFCAGLNNVVNQITKEETAANAISGMMQAAFHLGDEGFSSTMPLPRYLRQSSAEEKLVIGGGN